MVVTAIGYSELTVTAPAPTAIAVCPASPTRLVEERRLETLSQRVALPGNLEAIRAAGNLETLSH